MRIWPTLLILMFIILVSACRTTETEKAPAVVVDAEGIAERILAVLVGDEASRVLTADEWELLQLVPLVEFNPHPLSSHPIYLDKILDAEAGLILRTRYDYSGGASSFEEILVERDRLEDYVRALVFTHFEGKSPLHLPGVLVRGIPAELEAGP